MKHGMISNKSVYIAFYGSYDTASFIAFHGFRCIAPVDAAEGTLRAAGEIRARTASMAYSYSASTSFPAFVDYDELLIYLVIPLNGCNEICWPQGWRVTIMLTVGSSSGIQ